MSDFDFETRTEEPVVEAVEVSHRLKEPAPSPSNRARIIINLSFTIPTEERQEFLPSYLASDAISVARLWIEDYKAGKITLTELAELADSINIQASR